MYQIGLVGKPSSLRHKVNQILNTNFDFHVLVFSNTSQLVMGFNHFSFSALIVVLDGLQVNQLKQLKLIDRNLRRIPIIFVAPEISPQVRASLKTIRYNTLSILDGRSEVRGLCSVVAKMSDGQPIFNRAYARYETNQMGEIAMGRETKGRVRIINLSSGGAQLELKDGIFGEGDEIILNVRSLRKTSYGIRGKIKWRDEKTKRAGIEFSLPTENQMPRLTLV